MILLLVLLLVYCANALDIPFKLSVPDQSLFSSSPSSSSSSPLSSSPPSSKSASQGSNVCGRGKADIFCPISHGGFHLYCLTVNYTSADGVCERNGYRLAALTDANVMSAWSTHRECSVFLSSAWVASYNGLPSDPCMANTVSTGYVLAGLGAQCQANTLPVLCQEIPVETVQSTATVSATMTSGTTTTTTTTTKSFSGTITTTTTTQSSSSSTTTTTSTTSPSQASSTTSTTTTILGLTKRSSQRPPVRLPGPWVMRQNEGQQQRQQRPQQRDCPDCGEVCPFQRPGLRVIRKTVPFSQAEAECCKRGWRLADLTTGQESEVALLLIQCYSEDLPSAYGIGWMRSWNGVGSAGCQLVQTQTLPGDNFQLSTVWLYRLCELYRFWPICEADGDQDSNSGAAIDEGRAAATCDGGWQGQVSTTSLPPATTTTTVRTVLARTVTITRTVCQCGQFGCDPDCWDSLWDEEFDGSGPSSSEDLF